MDIMVSMYQYLPTCLSKPFILNNFCKILSVKKPIRFVSNFKYALKLLH